MIYYLISGALYYAKEIPDKKDTGDIMQMVVEPMQKQKLSYRKPVEHLKITFSLDNAASLRYDTVIFIVNT